MIEKSITEKRPYLNIDEKYLSTIFQKIDDKLSDDSKNTEIDDLILRQILFLFNLELWYRIFLENENIQDVNLSINKFL